jgi:peptidoglycan/xylan/chitin deacetylase (PgdA/CDA1 family)
MSRPEPTSLPTATPVPEPTATIPQPAPTQPPAPTPTLAPSGEAMVVTRVQTGELVIALTFDAGADRGYAEQILDTLKAEGIKATFGMTGRWAEDNPDLVRRMVEEGHQLINHTYSHPSFTGRSTGQPPLSTEERLAEIQRLEDVVAEVTGSRETMRPYFRPPYGDYDELVLRDLPLAGYTVVVMWSVDSLGWNGLSAQEITERCLAGAEPGGIILMHVGAQSEDAQALPGLIAALRERGYRFVTVAELLALGG